MSGEMHCDIAVIYDTESGVAQIPSVSRIIVSQHKHLSVVLLQLKLSVKYTPPYQRKKKRNYSSQLTDTSVFCCSLWLVVNYATAPPLAQNKM